MANQSRFFKATEQVLIEYKTDQYKINKLKPAGTEDTQFYMYIDNNNEQKLIELSAVNRAEFVLNDKSTMYYPGKGFSELGLSSDPGQSVYGSDIYANDRLVGTVLKSEDGDQLRSASVNKDTIKIYLLTGYNMNSIYGYSLKIKAKISKVRYKNPGSSEYIVKRIDDTLTLLDWYLPKDELFSNIHWMSNPLYLNSKFYDRYIEVPVISFLDAAIYNPGNASCDPDFYRNIDYIYEYQDPETKETIYFRGYIDQFAALFVEFSTIQENNITLVKDSPNGETEFIKDNGRIFTLMQNSNANNVNVRLFEDEETHTIKYYPVYGDITASENASEFNYELMAAINAGNIPMLNFAQMDNVDDGIDDFIEMYGDETFKWVIINELSVAYVYEPIYEDTTNDRQLQTFYEYYTNTIDYTGKSDDDGEFWKSQFMPFIKDRINMQCCSIIISYNCHLFNRVNNTDIVRQASMTITDPYKYKYSTINSNSIVQYKIVNKIEKTIVNNTIEGKVSTPTYIREYYDTTNIVIKDMSSDAMYSQGKMVLKLYRTSSNYALRLFKINDDNVRVAYDLAGNIDYKIVFPSTSSSKIEILPNKDSDKYNLQNGQLIFYISGDKAGAIMSVPASERYFAITTHIAGSKNEETTLYEGTVEWV